MSKSKNLIKNTLIYTIGNLGSKVFSFLLLPIYSYFLTKGELGEYDLITTTITLFIPLVSLQISQANYRWLIDNDGSKFTDKQIFVTALSSLIILTLISSAFIFFVGKFKQINHLVYIILLLNTSIFYPFIQDSLRGMKNNKLYAKIGIINSVLVLVFTIVFLYFTDLKIEALLLASILANSFSILLGLKGVYSLIQKINFSLFDKKLLKRMLIYAWPLIPSAVSWWLINASNRYIILLEFDADANGIYAISSRLPAIIFIFNSIFMLAWQDFILMENKDSTFSKRVFDMLSKGLLSLVFMMIVWSKFIVKWAFHPDFVESWKYMGILFLSVAFSCFAAYFGTVYMKEKQTRQVLTTTIAGGILNILISFLLINKIGLFAPAIGTLVGFIAVFIIRIAQTNKFYPIPFHKRSFTFFTLICLVSIALTLADNQYINIFLCTASIPIFFFLAKDNLKFLLNRIKK